MICYTSLSRVPCSTVLLCRLYDTCDMNMHKTHYILRKIRTLWRCGAVTWWLCCGVVALWRCGVVACGAVTWWLCCGVVALRHSRVAFLYYFGICTPCD